MTETQLPSINLHEPTDCPKCGTPRTWVRAGVRKGVVQHKQKCRPCHRASLAVDRAKYGGAAARNKRWEQRNRLASIAHKKVEYHLSVGNIVRRPCERCGDPDTQAHHDDYNVPLEVRWLCPKHHAERHHSFVCTGSSPANPAEAATPSPQAQAASAGTENARAA